MTTFDSTTAFSQRLRPTLLLRHGRAQQAQPQQQQQGGGGKGSAPAPAPPPPPPPPPVIDDTAGQAQDAKNALEQRKGPESTDVTGDLGVATPPTTSNKVILGA